MSEPDPDAMAVQRLAKSGSDLSKLHRVEFHLSFPSENAAADAVARLEELAFATTLERDDATDEWVVLAAKTMYPVQSDLAGLRKQLESVAVEGGGSYEGWRATQRE